MWCGLDGGRCGICSVNAEGKRGMHTEAEKFLSRADPVMAGLIARVGPCGLKPEPRRTPFQSLVQAVTHQQLNGRAAETILGRFRGLFPGRRFPRPEDVAAVEEDLVVDRTLELSVHFQLVLILIMSGVQKQNSRGVISFLILDLCKSNRPCVKHFLPMTQWLYKIEPVVPII